MGTPLENIDQSAYAVPNFFTKVNLINHLFGDQRGAIARVGFYGYEEIGRFAF